MKVLLDNNVPVPLRNYLKGHQVYTARQMNWHELKNGELLAAAEVSGFDVMVTGDKNLPYQQNLSGRQLGIVMLPTTNWKVLRTTPEAVASAVDRVTRGSFEQL